MGKTKTLRFRASSDEEMQIKKSALASDMDYSEYVRRCSLQGIVFKKEVFILGQEPKARTVVAKDALPPRLDQEKPSKKKRQTGH